MRSLLCLAVLAGAAFAADTHKLVRVYEKLPTERPIAVVMPDDGSGREFLALQRGKILILPKSEQAAEAKTFLDLSTRGMEAKDGLFEEGLNGLAFHPKFKDNSLFYLCYTMQKPKRLVVTEMKAAGDTADEKSERVLLEVPLINWNHHGGNILFGPDGFLYIGIGDNSKRNGELKMSQLNAVLYGKIARIDVNSREYSNAYGIPADNPFASGVNALPQIYATGIRNPWGMSFDAKGHLWCADVGQDLWEEINWITNGGNYGWQYREGPSAFALNTDTPPADAKFIEPVHSYNHGEGLSITGGYVHTGDTLPELKGAYVYGDFVLGKVWALKVDDSGKVLSNDLLFTSPQTPADNPKKKPTVLIKPTAFCPNAKGDILVLDWNGGVYKLTK
ncbi:MAG: PQQ-dependent sugar dehydrogenase [Verrucomicrobiaceae bacterium]|nr:PQQ-dependent sugar dehydrogenase [Verrucomicrobiaceae bacterium]